MVEYGLFPLLGKLFMFSLVNTDWNCSFRISALLLLSLCKNPILKPHKAIGPDSITSCILKAAADQLAPILTELYQTSLNTGVVPQDWKDAHVVPLFKKDERHLASNYRPVSLTSIQDGIESGPIALWGFRFFKSVWTTPL
jgi:hypothetical protein